jgi:acyl carrier protein
MGQQAATVPDVAEAVVVLIGGHFSIDPALVVLQASLIDDLDADSLDRVELVIAFEEAFGINIPDADLERIRTVHDAIEYIQLRTVSG